MTDIETTIVDDAKRVAHRAIAAGAGALGGYLTANAMRLSDDIVTGNIEGLEHLGVGVVGVVAVASWGAARIVLARIFGGTS